MKKYIEQLVQSLDLKVIDDVIMIDDSTPVKIGGVPLVIPSKHNVDTLVEPIDGKIKAVKVLFDPFTDDLVKQNRVLNLLMKYMVVLSNVSITHLVESLLQLASDVELQKDAPSHLQKYLAGYSSLAIKGKYNVDSKTLTAFRKIVASKGAKLKYTEFYLKKGGKLNGQTYNRLLRVHFPFMDEFEKTENTLKCDNVVLRDKDYKAIMYTLNFIFPERDEGNYDIGSKDKDYPGYFVVYEGFISIYGRINFLLEKLEFMNKEIKDTLHLPLLDEEQLHSLKKHSKELAILPTDNIEEKSVSRKDLFKDISVKPHHVEPTYVEPVVEQSGWKQRETHADNRFNKPVTEHESATDRLVARAHANDGHTRYVGNPMMNNANNSSNGMSIFSQPQQGGFNNQNTNQYRQNGMVNNNQFGGRQNNHVPWG